MLAQKCIPRISEFWLKFTLHFSTWTTNKIASWIRFIHFLKADLMISFLWRFINFVRCATNKNFSQSKRISLTVKTFPVFSARKFDLSWETHLKIRTSFLWQVKLSYQESTSYVKRCSYFEKIIFHQDKRSVKLIKRVKIADSFSQFVSNQFHIVMPM